MNIILCIVTVHNEIFSLTIIIIQWSSLGGEARGLGGEASPLPPPLDETLPVRSLHTMTLNILTAQPARCSDYDVPVQTAAFFLYLKFAC